MIIHDHQGESGLNCHPQDARGNAWPCLALDDPVEHRSAKWNSIDQPTPTVSLSQCHTSFLAENESYNIQLLGACPKKETQHFHVFGETYSQTPPLLTGGGMGHDPTLRFLLLRLHMHWMLRYDIIRYLLFFFHTDGMLHYDMFSCICTI